MSDWAPERGEIAGLILAGGRARRLGGVDKGLVQWAGRPLVEWAIAALAPQVATLSISANRNLQTYAAYGYPTRADRHPGFPGPLAGIAAALADSSAPWVLCLPCDSPCPPADLGARLARALAADRAQIAAASDGTRLQPLHALIPVALAASLESFLAGGGRSAQDWYRRHRLAVADFGDCPLAFANLNTPQDAARLLTLAAANTGESAAFRMPRK
jgi:molybdenum cofactor guanylyltransferase